MAHRSVPRTDPDPIDTDVDPFWHEALAGGPPLGRRLAELGRTARSWLVVAVGVLVVAGAGWWLLRPAAPPIESTLPAAEATSGGTSGGAGASAPVATGSAGVGAGATTSTTGAPVVVQAAGAVAEPGVYTLEPGARVDDLVRAAGGVTDEADADRVNLAAPVADGERVWIPSQGEAEVPDVVAGTGGGAPGGAGGSAGSRPDGAGAAPSSADPVDLNQATAEDLDALPGVGPATATAILAYRDEHGRFGSVDELLEVRGIGEAKLEQLRPLVRV